MRFLVFDSSDSLVGSFEADSYEELLEQKAFKNKLAKRRSRLFTVIEVAATHSYTRPL